jgi:hypothetical protein
MKSIGTILLVFIVSSYLFSQQQILVSPDNDVIPLVKGESASKVVQKATHQVTTVTNLSCDSTLLGGFNSYMWPGTSILLANHKEVEAMWFVAPYTGHIDTIFWDAGDYNGALDSQVIIRIHKANIGLHSGPDVTFPPPCFNWGYYPSTYDADQGITPFPEDSTGNWVSTSPSPYTSYPLMGNLLRLGVGKHTTNAINSIPLALMGGPLYVTKGDSFWISMQPKFLNQHYTGEGSTGWWVSSYPPPPARVWKFYEHPTSTCGGTAVPGWKARMSGVYNWWFSMTDQENIPPKITNVTILHNTTSTNSQTVTADILDCNFSNPSGGSVSSAKIKWSIFDVAQTDITMTNIGETTYQGVIPGEPAGKRITYSVWAIDGEGLSSESKSYSYQVCGYQNQWYTLFPGVPYQERSIRTTGTIVQPSQFFNPQQSRYAPADDGTAGPFDIGGNMNFNGNNVRYAWIGVNGAIALTATATDTQDVNSGGYYTYWNIPNGLQHNGRSDTAGRLGIPKNFISAFWNDLVLNDSTNTYGTILQQKGFAGDSCLFIVEWDSLGNFAPFFSSDIARFRIILNRCMGDIEYQYSNVGLNGLDSTALIGIEKDSSGLYPGDWINANSNGYPLETRPQNNWSMKFFHVPPPNLPNLAVYQSNGWSDKIVVSNVRGTTTDPAAIYPGDSLYVDWAIINNDGSATADTFITRLLVDGVIKQSWLCPPPLNPGVIYSVTDFNVGVLPLGSHTFQVITDATNRILESYESDNSYSKLITVIAPINLSLYQLNGWSDKIVVSNVRGTATDAAVIYRDDSLYIDWAVINNGVVATSDTFFTKLSIDGVAKQTWRCNPPLNPGQVFSIMDFNIGVLSPGVHTFLVNTDSTNRIIESSESDNTYSKTKTVINFSGAITNDECTGAIVIPTLPDSFLQNTRHATTNPTDPTLTCADGGGGKTVWYKYTPTSSGWVKFTTQGSMPDSFDIAMGIFTGTCGSLSMVACNDDIAPNIIRQSEIILAVTAGTTYTILIGEWKGGGNLGGIPTGGDLQFRVSTSGPPPPIVRGPKSGSVPNGVVVTTDGRALASVYRPAEQGEIENEPDVPLLPAPKDVMHPKGRPGSNYIEEKVMQPAIASQPFVINDFEGFNPTGYIPPDPILAVGPNHVIAVVNSSFRIFDKQGNLLKDISLDSWFSSVVSPVSASDPQVIYDHYSHRWAITIGSYSAPYKLLLSISDDENPLGTWYNWALPAGLGDSLTGNLPDYPQLGYDEQAIYLTTREFTPAFKGSRLRIIPKPQLYANTAGSVTWTDFGEFRDPDHRTVLLDGIRPSQIYGAPGVHFLVNASPYYPGTFMTLWTITNPVTAPVITGVNIPVVQYSEASNPNQLGGGTPIEGGRSAIRFNAIYRDSSLYMVHPIASGTGNAYSALHYVRVNPFTKQNLEDIAMGLDGYWHFYPTLMVNAAHDIIMTYTRSGLTEYPGAYVGGRKSTDPPGLSPSIPLKKGEDNYDTWINLWGDYMGAGLDPVDTTSVWVHSEFSIPNNHWSTRVGKVRIGLQPGAWIAAQPGVLNFGNSKRGTIGDTLSAVITNYGLDTLIISAITLADTNFHLLPLPAFPKKLGGYQTMTLSASFTPKDSGQLSASVYVSSNDTARASFSINLQGYSEVQAIQLSSPHAGQQLAVGNLFPITWVANFIDSVKIEYSTNNGVNWSTIIAKTPGINGSYPWTVPNTPSLLCKMRVSDAADGSPSVLSNGNFAILLGGVLTSTMTVNNSWNLLSVPLKVNHWLKDSLYPSAKSDAFIYQGSYIPRDTLRDGLAYWLKFESTDSVYFVGLPIQTETVYVSKDWNMIGSTSIPILATSVVSDPPALITSNFFGYDKNYFPSDTIYPGKGYWSKVSQAGKLILSSTPDIALLTKNAIRIVPINELPPRPPFENAEEKLIPTQYSLEQAYPNPFNPTTTIKYSLPVDSRVILKVYNTLGQVVTILSDEIQQAGFKSAKWDATGISSGVYFYKLEAVSVSEPGKTFTQVKKMVLVR